MLTFFERCQAYRTTLLVVQDTNGWKFGGLCTEMWRVSTSFYGTGENFLFTFKKSNQISVYPWTGNDDQYQWANNDLIGLGGGIRGRFGLSLKDNLYKGTSAKTSTFENEILSSDTDFVCTDLEVWGLD